MDEAIRACKISKRVHSVLQYYDLHDWGKEKLQEE